MNFTEDNALVQTWVRVVKNGQYEKEQVPNIGNLRDIVNSVLEAKA
ncbi:hypothetical protein [Clostridium sp. KNHs205]|nr:hypothetical protein [Clostridium sp. KNHs205]